MTVGCKGRDEIKVEKLSHNVTEVKLESTSIKLSQIAMENEDCIREWGQKY